MTIATFGSNTGNTLDTADCTIKGSSPNANDGAALVATLDFTNNNFILLKFTGLTGIGAVSSVNSATLSAYLGAKGGEIGDFTLSGNLLLQNWDEASATYNIFSTGNNWNTAGANGSGIDIAVTPAFSGKLITDVISEYKSIAFDAQGLTDLKNIINLVVPNYGFKIYPTAGTGYRNFVTHEGADTTRFYLTLDYTLAAAGGNDFHFLNDMWR